MLRAGLAALPMALLVLSQGASAAPASVGGCYYPSVAVDIYAVNFFDDIEISDDPGHRKAQCKDFLKGCKKTIKHVTNCVESGFAALENAAYVECKDLTDPEDREACKDDLESANDDFDDELDYNKSAAEQECRACYEDCLAGDSCFEVSLE
jgi:hypothetical protein